MPALPYHDEVALLLQRLEPQLWQWMAGGRIAAQSDQLRTDLLRTTYRIDADAHPEILQAAERAAAAVGVDVPVAVYQTEGEAAPNAALVFVPDEAIVLLSGPIAEMLDGGELTAVLGHELAHHALWTSAGGDHLVADRLVNAMVGDTGSPVVAETARRLALTTELYADRGALQACGDLYIAIGALVKAATGMRSVSSVAYLRQAEEAVVGAAASTAHSHPETFIRVIALRDWAEGESDATRSERLVHGPPDIDALDLADQALLAARTRQAIDLMLAPDWMRTDAMLGNARAFFADAGTPVDAIHRDTTAERPLADSSRRYLAFVLLDLAVADPDLDRQPLVEALAVATALGLEEELESIVDAELRLSPAERRTVQRDAAERRAQRS
jgi:Zn-dependent protease with chaperone function